MTTRPPTVRGVWRHHGWKGFTVRELVRVMPVETLATAAAIGFLAARALRRR